MSLSMAVMKMTTMVVEMVMIKEASFFSSNKRREPAGGWVVWTERRFVNAGQGCSYLYSKLCSLLLKP